MRLFWWATSWLDWTMTAPRTCPCRCSCWTTAVRVSTSCMEKQRRVVYDQQSNLLCFHRATIWMLRWRGKSPTSLVIILLTYLVGEEMNINASFIWSWWSPPLQRFLWSCDGQCTDRICGWVRGCHQCVYRLGYRGRTCGGGSSIEGWAFVVKLNNILY